MAEKIINLQDYSNFYPWKISTTEMLPNLLLMSKLLLFLLILNGFHFHIQDPFLPFLSLFDVFNNYPKLFKYTLRLVFTFFTFTLLFNIKPKLSCLILGMLIIIVLLSSKPLFRNHIFIVGCALFLAGLSENKGIPWLLVLQMSLIYFGASLNKAFQMDWWTGQFMHNWLAFARENPIYLYISNVLPHLWFAKFLSWSAIIVEFLIGLTILSKKYRLTGIWLLIIFHFAMFTMLAFRFGHFLQDLFIILLAFLEWPKQKIIINYDSNKEKIKRKIVKILDFDRLFLWVKETNNPGNHLNFENNSKNNRFKNPFFSRLIYCTGFYLILLLIDFIIVAIMHYVQNPYVKYSVHVLFCMICWSLIVMFFPKKIIFPDKVLAILKFNK